MKNLVLSLVVLLTTITIKAQIGYQVTLMDQSTGKPRANETVSVTVTISDNTNKVVCKSTQNATTNDFGMLALQVGDASTFNDFDWSKLPLWVSATVGGVTIAKSQILNVPVAEHAKHTGTLTKELLTSKTWSYTYESYDDKTGKVSITFTDEDTFIWSDYDGEDTIYRSGSYSIENNTIFLKADGGDGMSLQYSSSFNTLFGSGFANVVYR